MTRDGLRALATVVYSDASRRLNAHIIDCTRGCRGGSGWDLCPTGERLLDDLHLTTLPDDDMEVAS